MGNAPFTTTTAHFPRVVALSLHICESQFHRSSAATLGEPRSPHFTDGRASWLPVHFSYSRSAVLHKPRVARAESCALVPNWSPGFCRVDGATSDWSPPRQYSPSELAAPPDLYKRNGLTDLIFPNASYIVEVFVFSYLVVFVFVLQRMWFFSLSDLSSNFPPGKPSINFLDHMYRYCIIMVHWYTGQLVRHHYL